jgi:hypothetical protein
VFSETITFTRHYFQRHFLTLRAGWRQPAMIPSEVETPKWVCQHTHYRLVTYILQSTGPVVCHTPYVTVLSLGIRSINYSMCLRTSWLFDKRYWNPLWADDTPKLISLEVCLNPKPYLKEISILLFTRFISAYSFAIVPPMWSVTEIRIPNASDLRTHL